MDEKKAIRDAEIFVDRQLKEYALWSRRPAFEELTDRLLGAFLMGYRAGYKSAEAGRDAQAEMDAEE